MHRQAFEKARAGGKYPGLPDQESLNWPVLSITMVQASTTIFPLS